LTFIHAKQLATGIRNHSLCEKDSNTCLMTFFTAVQQCITSSSQNKLKYVETENL